MADDPDVTAAELALGLLEGAERAAALRRVLAEPAFARDVEAWRLHFAQLFDLWPEADAPEDMIERIDSSIGGPARVRRARFPWPTLAIASTAVAAGLIAYIGVREPVAPPATPVVAARTAPLLVAALDAGPAQVPAVFDTDAGSLRIASAPEMPAARAAQLWVIGADGVPHALALLGRTTSVVALSPADRARIAAGATLAISIEPLGGSPTGLPTGPVVAKGVLARI